MSTSIDSVMDKAERIRKFGEVFTQPNTVCEMCDMLERESPDAFEIGKTYLEPACGEGAFVIEILRRKFRNCNTRKDYSDALKSVWAMDIQPWCVEATIRHITELCEKHFHPTKADYQTISEHVIQCDSLKVMRMMNELNERDENEKRQGKPVL